MPRRLAPLLLCLLLAWPSACAQQGPKRETLETMETAPSPEASEAKPEPEAEAKAEPKAESTGETPAEKPPEGGEGTPARPERKREILLSTEFDDAKVGEEQAKQVEQEMGLVKDEAIVAYVREIGARLLRYAPQRHFDYDFEIVDQETPNAFALPGGKIYVSRGLLALVQDEDELACVLGHEITHAAERHAAGRQERARRINPFSIGYMRLAQIAAYGRDQERDADRGGQMLCSAAGYDPMAIASFLQRLDAVDRYEIGWSRLPFFLATHPTSPERAATAAARAQTMEWTRKPGIAQGRIGYLDKMKGLILGINPAEGVLEEGRLVHADLDFTVRFPAGWETTNSHDSVWADSPDGRARIGLRLAGEGANPEPVARKFIAESVEGVGGEVLETQPFVIGELPAFRVRARARTEGGILSGEFTFIGHRDLVYLIETVTRAGATDDYIGRGRSVVRSFRALSPEERDAVRITHLDYALAREGETLEAIAKRMHSPLPLPVMTLLNGVFPGTPIEAGRPIKIGVETRYAGAPKEDS